MDSENSETSSRTRIGGNIPCRYSMSTILAYDQIEYKHITEKDYLKKFCESLREHAKKCNWFRKKKICEQKEKKNHIKVKGQHIKYVGGGSEDFCGGHKIF